MAMKRVVSLRPIGSQAKKRARSVQESDEDSQDGGGGGGAGGDVNTTTKPSSKKKLLVVKPKAGASLSAEKKKKNNKGETKNAHRQPSVEKKVESIPTEDEATPKEKEK